MHVRSATAGQRIMFAFVSPPGDPARPSQERVQQAYKRPGHDGEVLRGHRCRSGHRTDSGVAVGACNSERVLGSDARRHTPVGSVMSSLDAGTAAALEQVMSRDPEAPVRRIASLSRIIGKALAAEQFEIAASVADVALRIHPESLPLLDAASEAREGRGDRTNAANLAAKCAATPSTNDWRTSATIARCRDRRARLRME